MSATAISDEKYVSSTTYRKSGAAVATPTWIVPLDGGRVRTEPTAHAAFRPAPHNSQTQQGPDAASVSRARPDAQG
jgi:hypothetical protein